MLNKNGGWQQIFLRWLDSLAKGKKMGFILYVFHKRSGWTLKGFKNQEKSFFFSRLCGIIKPEIIKIQMLPSFACWRLCILLIDLWGLSEELNLQYFQETLAYMSYIIL